MFYKNRKLSLLLFFLLGMLQLFANALSKSAKRAIKNEVREAAEAYNQIAWDLLKSLSKNGLKSFAASLPDSFCIAKLVKVILRVKINSLKIYPQNNRCHFSDANNYCKKYHQINKIYFNDTCEVRCL